MPQKRAAAEAEKAAADKEAKEKTLANVKKAADVVTQQAGSSSSPGGSAAAEPSGKTALEAALAKPILQRSGEELRITGRAGKIRKTETAAADLDLSNL